MTASLLKPPGFFRAQFSKWMQMTGISSAKEFAQQSQHIIP